MPGKIYLEGGGDIREGENDELDLAAIGCAKNKRVYVLDLTSNDEEKVAQYRSFFEQYFKRLGVEEIGFASLSESLEEIKGKLGEAGIVYLPGGDTEVLIDNLRQRKIGSLLENLESVIIGNSAGAMVLCREAICAKEGREIMEGVGVLDLAIEVHYDETHDEAMNELSEEREIYGVPEKGAIIAEDGNLEFVGEVYLFSKGKKERAA
jgi:peptidase E|tara:strand:+ start:146 stop:769 length:624 start_codon:yes stop_codon:yes gene_type:complete